MMFKFESSEMLEVLYYNKYVQVIEINAVDFFLYITVEGVKHRIFRI